MSTHSPPAFSELSTELFHAIVERLPLAYRPATILSLALACRRLRDIVFPELLYDSMHLVGEDQALQIFNTLIAKAELVTEEDIQTQGNPSISHCIHHLSLNTEIETPIRTYTSLDALKKLIEINGLRHLKSLSLYPNASWDKIDDDSSRIKLPFLASLKTACPNLKRILVYKIRQKYQEEWIKPHVFSLENMTSIRINSLLLDYPTPTIDILQLPTTTLHTLELRLYDYGQWGQPINATALLHSVIPNLRTLILDYVDVSDTVTVNAFWRAHPGIERLELYYGVKGNWFDGLQDGMLINLKHLLCTFDHARLILPRVSMSLITLTVCDTWNAQGPYLLRVLCPGGVLPSLRSLGIYALSGDITHMRESDIWREDEDVVPLAQEWEQGRKFDGNYIMSLAKAAPNLEELELMGYSNDTLESLSTSLSMFPKLSRLTLSGGMNDNHKPFFPRSRNWEDYKAYFPWGLHEDSWGPYAPATFDEAARDLANGCRTLDIITMGNILHELYIWNGQSRRIIRVCDGGEVKELRKIKPWGNLIGREDEW